jgi:hypothetical protein
MFSILYFLAGSLASATPDLTLEDDSDCIDREGLELELEDLELLATFSFHVEAHVDSTSPRTVDWRVLRSGDELGLGRFELDPIECVSAHQTLAIKVREAVERSIPIPAPRPQRGMATWMAVRGNVGLARRPNSGLSLAVARTWTWDKGIVLAGMEADGDPHPPRELSRDHRPHPRAGPSGRDRDFLGERWGRLGGPARAVRRTWSGLRGRAWRAQMLGHPTGQPEAVPEDPDAVARSGSLRVPAPPSGHLRAGLVRTPALHERGPRRVRASGSNRPRGGDRSVGKIRAGCGTERAMSVFWLVGCTGRRPDLRLRLRAARPAHRRRTCAARSFWARPL